MIWPQVLTVLLTVGKLEEFSNELNHTREEEGIHPKEKEKLMDDIRAMPEVSEGLKKQVETEPRVESSLRQEASRLTMENRVRSGLSC